MMKLIQLVVAVMAVTPLFAQNKKQQDVNAIKAMCGCYQVSFDYTETFASDTNYEFHDSYHTSAPAEWVFVAEEDENKIVLQHLLVVQDTMIIKHWRQDWLYENQDFHAFDKNKTWRYNKADVKDVEGQWTQFVYQVDDSPRYMGSATWVHYDGNHYWENTSDAPLPRREFTKRSDYNVMVRTNKQVLTDYGWLHEQDNLKVLRESGVDSILVAEKGLNAYRKTENAKCEAARVWWKENEAYWGLVRNAWQKVFDEKQDLALASKVEEKMLWQELFSLGDSHAKLASSKPKEVEKMIDEMIKTFQLDAASASAK